MSLFETRDWKNINLIFPEGGTFLDGKWFSNEDIQESGLPSISSPVQTPIRLGIDNEVHITWYSNGDMTRHTVYNTFPPNMTDNIPPFNIYAQKMLNQILLNLPIDKEENCNYDFESTYSSL